MKVLQLHNTYRHFGGEDVVVNLEYNLLKDNDIDVEQLLFDNENLSVTDLFYNKNTYKTVEQAIQLKKPDIIHIHNLFYKASPSVMQCAKDYNIPVVLTLHNYRLICPNGLLLRDEKPCLKCVNKAIPLAAVKYKCFQNSRAKTLALSLSLSYHNKKNTWNNLTDRIIVLTEFAKNTILNSTLNISKNKVVVKPNSVDDFQYNSTSKRKDYLYIGRLSNEKGSQIAIQAFNKMLDKKLHVIGTGPLEEELINQSKR